MARKIQFKRGTAASWTSTDPTLAIGELGLETDTGKMKIGDGVTAWSARPYIDAAAVAHIAASASAHAASAIANTPAGGIAATTVQAALNELDTEKAPLASPALTGTPTAPTAATATNTTQVATTAYVKANRAEQAAADASRYVAAIKPELFGAVGDGVTDDTAALTATFTAATQGTVYLSGVYLVTPILAAPTFVVGDNTTITGPGTIKVKNSAVAYHSLFGNAIGGSLTNFTMDGITVDQNGVNNDFASFTSTTARFVLYVTDGANIVVRNCTFKNLTNVNTLLFDCNPAGATFDLTDVSVINNQFLNIGGVLHHDHSCIYAYASSVDVSHNLFTGNTTDFQSAVTAIETHGSEMTVIGNRIRDMFIGIAITGVAYASDGVTVAGNTITGAGTGISIVTLYYDGNTTAPAIRGLVIDGNTIRCDIDKWNGWDVYAPCHGIGYIGTDAHMENVTITNNIVEATTNSSTDANLVDSNSAGIILQRLSNLSNIDRRFSIQGNTVRNWPSAGIWFAAPVTGLIVSGNILEDNGGTQVISGYRAGVYVSGTLVDATVSRNKILGSRTEVGVQWLATTTTRCVVEDNDIYITGGSALGYGLYGSAQPRVRASGSGSPLNVISALIGSTFVRTDGGTTTTLYVKEADNNASTGWVAK